MNPAFSFKYAVICRLQLRKRSPRCPLSLWSEQQTGTRPALLADRYLLSAPSLIPQRCTWRNASDDTPVPLSPLSSICNPLSPLVILRNAYPSAGLSLLTPNLPPACKVEFRSLCLFVVISNLGQILLARRNAIGSLMPDSRGAWFTEKRSRLLISRRGPVSEPKGKVLSPAGWNFWEL